MTTTDGEADRPSIGSGATASQRLDKWLWFARIVKSRTLAAEVITQGRVRVNRTRVVKASQAVRIGDVLTIALRGRVRVLKVVAEGTRRGPPPEARRLYEDLSSPAPDAGGSATGARFSGAGRPTKRDRRQIERLTEEE
jgi:ribosome-associated heat shock protein Hsp15